jgi:two-component system, cell cycle response regulator
MARDRTNERTTAAPAPQTPPVERTPFLLVLSGPRVGYLHKLARDKPTIIGRMREVDLCIDDDGVSRRHCTIQPTPRGALLVDLESHNGTFVDGVRIDQKTLGVDDRFQIGVHTTIKFTVADEMEAEVQRSMAEAALREPLTGLYNRRHFQERFAAEVAVARRHERPLSLLVADVDDFKRVNDRYGHAAGDEVLKAFAGALRATVRESDVAGRWGGEEFAMVLPGTDAAGGARLAERARTAIEARPVKMPNGDLCSVTASFGVAAYPDSRELGEILAAADTALYAAKDAGKNRVIIATEPITT